jgi:PAS domain S-box-containing protein
MEIIFDSLVAQPWYFYYLSGIFLILLGSALLILPRRIRDSHHSNYLTLCFLSYGLSRLLTSLYLILNSSETLFINQLFQLLTLLFGQEFIRRNWKKAFGFSISALVHIPLSIVFAIALFFTGDLFFGPGAIITTILAIILSTELYFGLKKSSHPKVRGGVFLTFSIAGSMIIQLILSIVNEQQTFSLVQRQNYSVIGPAQIFQLVSLVFFCILMLIMKTKANLIERSNKKAEAWEIFSPITFLLLLASINIAGAVLSKAMVLRENRRIETRLEKSREGLEKLINQRILFANTSSSLISGTPVLANFLDEQTPENKADLDQFLNRFSQNFPDGICYLMNKEGLVVAASDKKELFLGRYLHFRSYFQQAILGQNGRLIDYGKFTNELGYYSAYPVYSHRTGLISGVCAVKRNLNDLNQYFELYHPSMLLDKERKVFLSSDLEQVGKKLHLTDKKSDSQTRIETGKNHSESENEVFISRADFFVSFFDLGIGDWQVLLMQSLEDIKTVKLIAFNVFSIFSLVLLGFFIGNVKKSELLLELQLAQKQFEAVFYNAPEGILIISPRNLEILSANAGFKNLFGFTHDPVGRSFNELLGNKKTAFKKTSHDFSGKSFLHEREFIRTDQSSFMAEVNGATTIFNGENAILLFIRNISSRIKYEEKLHQAKVEAEEANRIKSRFLAFNSHEIRTPLTTIIGLNEMIRKDCSDQEQRKLLDLSAATARTLLDLLNDTLDLSQIEAGKLRIDKRPFNLKDMLWQLKQITSIRAEQKNVTVKMIIDDRIPEIVISDGNRIRQILSNLTGNALKFTSSGEIKLEAILSSANDKDLTLKFIIEDTGEGISEDVKTNLFREFVHSAPQNPEELRGTGLGLAITKQLIELLDGTIRFESQRGKGTTFLLEIPVKAGESTEVAQDDKKSETNKIELVSDNRPLRFLVADDNETNLFLATSILQEYGGETSSALNGLEALKLLEKEQFDAALLDIQMPELDGLETIKRIRNSENGYSSLPILALSAFSTEEERNEAIEAGANEYLSKPYFPQDLLQALQKILPEKCVALKQPEQNAPEQLEVKSAPTNDSKELNLKQINLHELQFRILQKPENILQINDIFSRRSEVLIDQLSECIKIEEAEKLRETAHSIKGLAGMLAANKAFQLALEIENLAKNNKIKQGLELVPILVSHIREIGFDLKLICADIRKK